MTHSLKFIPLGGLGEVGKNLALLEYDNQAIMIDCGLMFPGSDMPGVDLVIPDITYLKEKPNLLKAIFITHGHEDHIGALPFVLSQIKAPVYATKLTIGFIKSKFKRNRGSSPKKVKMHTIADGDAITVGPFRIEPFYVSHSIPDAVGMIIHTPVGVIVHTGEYKFDEHPHSGLTIDAERLRSVGDEGVLLLLSDSTNAERFGFTPSEKMVYENISEIFAGTKGRIITATFSSNIYRVQLLADIAIAHKRKIAFVGRSLLDNTRIARETGFLKVPDDIILPIERIVQLPDSQVSIVCTGTQGERNSALVRMANEEHSQVRIRESDTIIISATTIPGNEELAHRTLDNLFRLGANVIYQALKPVHVSGHASREGQKKMLSLIRPKYFIPIQGEYRMMALHAELGRETGLAKENIYVIENGQIIEFDPEGRASIGEEVHAGHVFVDGLSVGDVGRVVLRDRNSLSRDGFVTCVVAVDEHTGDLVDGPDLVSRGFVYVRDNEAMLDDAADAVAKTLKKLPPNAHPDTISSMIHDTLARFFRSQTRRQPMIFPVVLEV